MWRMQQNLLRALQPMMVVDPVQFKSDLDYPETTIIQERYRPLGKNIAHLYSQGDLLEITLNRLISED